MSQKRRRLLFKANGLRNLSDRNLTAAEEAVLKRGLNFAVTPTKIPVHEYVIGVESACHLLGAQTHTAARLRADCTRIIRNAKPPTPNISTAEQEALKSLSKYKDITILPADKGRLIVLMNTKDYISKSMDILGDTNTYKVLEKDPTKKFADELKSKLWEIRLTNNKKKMTPWRMWVRLYGSNGCILHRGP